MFILQTENGQVLTDMGKAIYESVQFEKWLHPNSELAVRLQEDTTPVIMPDIPIGSIEWTQAVSGIRLQPDNLPACCWKQNYAPRGGFAILTKEELEERLHKDPQTPLFIKSATKCKGWEAQTVNSNIDIPDDTLYFCSNTVSFTEEWRVFVTERKIMDVRRYLGDWDRELTRKECQKVQEWVSTLEISYPVYTLDIGRTDDGHLEVIELHQFIACGLYGFSDLSAIRRMAAQAWRYAVQKAQG